jgi:hypothetical protein
MRTKKNKPENAIGHDSEAHQVAEVIHGEAATLLMKQDADELLFLFLLVVSVMGDTAKVAASIN